MSAALVLFCLSLGFFVLQTFFETMTREANTKLNLGHCNKVEIEYQKIDVLVHVLQTTQNFTFLSFHVFVLQKTTNKCTKIYIARAQQLFCSLNLLFSDVPVAVAVVVFLLNPLISCD